MNVDQAKEVLRFITATWRVEMTEDQAEVWMDTLADRQPAHARDASRALRDVAEIVPSHAQFVSAYNIAKNRAEAHAEERQLGEPGGSRCANDCTDGWIKVSREGQDTVERCDRCNPTPDPKAEHPPRCTCMRCYYGPKRAAAIRGGYDGMGGPRKAPLEPAGAPPTEDGF